MLQQFFESMFGITATVAIMLVALLAGVGYLKSSPKYALTGRNATMAMAFSAIAISLGTILSFITIMKLPQGGSVTLLSMFVVSIIGYFYGPVQGIICGVAYGMLQLVIDPYVIHPVQLLLDYPLAFGMLGLSGIFPKRKFGIIGGFLVGVSGRFVCSLLSGVIFFSEYAAGSGMSPLIYSVVYNGSYMGAEAVITCIILCFAPVRGAIDTVKRMALRVENV